MKRIYDTIRLTSVDSTNNEAKKLSESDNLTVITTFGQTAGRGQRGNTWHSTPGMNLTFSILVRWGRDGVPAMNAADQFAVSRIVTVALTGFLASKGLETRIKWPNDIYAGDRKICGILIENTVCGAGLSSSVIGIGLNINETTFPDSIPNPTSVCLETGVRHGIDSCLEEFLECFDMALSLAENARGLAELEKTYLDRMYRKDTPHRYIDLTSTATDGKGGREFTGIIRGVAPNACLLVENEKGELHQFAFKEIGYII